MNATIAAEKPSGRRDGCIWSAPNHGRESDALSARVAMLLRRSNPSRSDMHVLLLRRHAERDIFFCRGL
jgi:hypothetical protein